MNSQVILLHGFLGTPREWTPTINFLEDPRCLPLSFSKLEQYSIRNLANSMYHQVLEYGPCHFVGYSMGGRVLLELYKNHPEIFKSLTLESVNPGLTESERNARQESDQRWSVLLQTNPEKFYIDWYSQPAFGFNKDNHPVYQQTVAEKIQNHLSLYAQMLLDASPANNPSLWEVLPQIDVPCFYLYGDRDQKCADIAGRISTQNPKIILKKFENTGHNCHAANPLQYAQYLKEFFGRLN